MGRNLLPRMSNNNNNNNNNSRNGGRSKQSFLLLALLHLIANGSGVNGISCYHCGQLSSNARAIEDCSGTITVEECEPNEACVVFKRLYVKGSESIRGCYPKDKTLPGLSGSLISPSQSCEFQPKGRSPVKVCMCTSDLCNANDYNIHVERANNLFSEGRPAANNNNNNVGISSPNLLNSKTISSNRTTLILLDSSSQEDLSPLNLASMNSVIDLSSSSSRNFLAQKVDSKILREGDVEREEVLWEEENSDQDESRRTPRQIRPQDFSFRGLNANNNNNFLKRIPMSQFLFGQDSPFFNQIIDGPVDCRWTDFSEWSDCSKTCGDGAVQTRERSIALLARRGGRPCSGESRETRTCNLIKCPPQRFGIPPVVCQTLNVLGATYANCDGQYVVTNERVEWAPDRPVFKHTNKDRYLFWNAHGLGWSIGKKEYLTTGSHWHRSGLDTAEPWQGTWSGGVFVECVGKQENEQPKTPAAAARPAAQAQQPPQQQQPSPNDSQGPTNCFWSSFGEWSRCSVSCGAGTQQRKRMVLQPARNGGLECVGEPIESRPCSQVACPVDCEWSEFDDWTECSASCAGGIQRRRRTVAVRASNGGQPCRGRDIESRPCNEDPCKIDCRWSELSPWSKCSQTCGPGGVQTRTRFIIQAPVGEGAQPCEGEQAETKECPNTPNCPNVPITTTATTTTTSSFSSTLLSEATTKSSAEVDEDEGITSEEQKLLDESFIEKLLSAINDVQTEKSNEVVTERINDVVTESTPEEVVVPALSNSCCDRIVVKAFGPAKDDQSLYLGTYNQITNYNGKAAYEKEGSDQLYIYFFISQSDQLSLWVIGPELGKFIAGIRNDGSPACVHDATEKWRYASRAGLWKEDDPTLQVKCYTPEDDVDSLAFGVRKTTTRLPVNKATTTTAAVVDEVSEENEEQGVEPIIDASVDCQWTDYGPWSACSATCDRGTQTRFRTVLKRQKPGGKACPGSSRETRSCNLQSCFNEIATARRPFVEEPTTRQPTLTTTTRATTTRGTTTTGRPRQAEPRREGLVKCFVCGSLFSTDAPDCQKFDFKDPSQQKTCDPGEACLLYTYQKSADEKAVIRECFSTSILLGSLDNPLEPQEQCNPQPVEDGDDSIVACICTDDFCNGYKDEDEAAAPASSRQSTQRPTPAPTTTQPSRTTTTTSRPRTESPFEREPERTTKGIIRPPTKPTLKPSIEVTHTSGGPNSDPNRVLCHQCGTLFSGTSGNSACTDFDESKPDQRSYCKPGEACLWYSWQKSDNEISTIRECFSPSILLGPITNPLTVKEECEISDISETPGSSIMACLCDSDLCNAKESVRGNPVALPQIGDAPKTSAQRVVTTTTTRRPPPTQAPARTTTSSSRRQPASQIQPDPDDLSPEELVALVEFGRAPGGLPEEPKTVPQDPQNKNRVAAVTQKPQLNNLPRSQEGGLKCFSCGSLLDPSRVCETFNPKNVSQVQTCGLNEGCLLYTWKKSSTESAVLRECFPISVLLGDVNDPLTPEDECSPRDISEPGSSGVTACLCTTSFCNVGDGSSGDKPPKPAIVSSTSDKEREQPRPTTVRTEVITTQRLAPQTTTKPPRRTQPLQEQTPAAIRLPQQKLTSCPSGFELVGFGCYSFSQDRMGWIEAKKMCELKEARLLVIETEKERDDILEHIISTQGRQRSRFEFWTAGNDIDRENVWVWSGGSEEIVPEFGWIEQPLPSAEENCLTWDITVSRGNFTPRGRQVTGNSGQRFTEGWHSDSCCNSVRYICELA